MSSPEMQQILAMLQKLSTDQEKLAAQVSFSNRSVHAHSLPNRLRHPQVPPISSPRRMFLRFVSRHSPSLALSGSQSFLLLLSLLVSSSLTGGVMLTTGGCPHHRPIPSRLRTDLFPTRLNSKRAPAPRGRRDRVVCAPLACRSRARQHPLWQRRQLPLPAIRSRLARLAQVGRY